MFDRFSCRLSIAYQSYAVAYTSYNTHCHGKVLIAMQLHLSPAENNHDSNPLSYIFDYYSIPISFVQEKVLVKLPVPD